MHRRLDRTRDDLDHPCQTPRRCDAQRHMLDPDPALLGDHRNDLLRRDLIAFQDPDSTIPRIMDPEMLKHLLATTLGPHRPRSHRKELPLRHFPTRILGGHTSPRRIVRRDLQHRTFPQPAIGRHDADIGKVSHADPSQEQPSLDPTRYPTSKIEHSASPSSRRAIRDPQGPKRRQNMLVDQSLGRRVDGHRVDRQRQVTCPFRSSLFRSSLFPMGPSAEMHHQPSRGSSLA